MRHLSVTTDGAHPCVRRPVTPGALRDRASAVLLAVAAILTVQLLLPVLALAQDDDKDKATGEKTPIDLGDGVDAPPADVGGGSIARVIAGLFVVVAVIYGVTWVLKRMKGAGTTGEGPLRTVASVPLQGGGALHLVHVGDEVLLVGSGSDGATTLRGWDQAEALDLGLINPDRPVTGDGDGGPGPRPRPTNAGAADMTALLAALGRRWQALLDRLREWTVRK
ncbi:MAG: flagellar biosynthetic protein FliO [Solirubrobacteraceae bacterium]|nr:flagellar biosynthetic protein FliO [Solirubrobacteraceae bacterium]